MFRDINTPRLLLKCISYDDAGFFYREFSNEDENRHLFDADPCSSEEEAKEWIDFYMEPEPRNQQRWIIVMKDTGESIGTSSRRKDDMNEARQQKIDQCTPVAYPLLRIPYRFVPGKARHEHSDCPKVVLCHFGCHDHAAPARDHPLHIHEAVRLEGGKDRDRKRPAGPSFTARCCPR